MIFDDPPRVPRVERRDPAGDGPETSPLCGRSRVGTGQDPASLEGLIVVNHGLEWFIID